MAHIAVDKPTLIAALKKSRAELETMVAKVPPEKWTQPGVAGEWNGKDVLAHLAEWEEMQIGWTEAVLRGESPEVPGPGLTFAQADLDKVNWRIYELHCHESFEQVLAYFREVHERFLAQLEAIPAERFVQKGYASFTGPKRTMVQYYIHYTFHDNWAKQLIYKHLVRKPRKQQ